MSQSQVARLSARQIAAAATLVGAVVLVGWLGRDDRAGTDVSVVGAIGLEEVSQQVGIEFLHRRPMLDPKLDNVAPHVAGIGAAVSIVDVDRDGWPDIYFTSSRIGDSNALFHNNQDGTFSDIAGEVGLADVNRRGEGASMGAVWGDIDNDGYEDVFVYKWGYPQLFRNIEGRRFEDITERAGLHHWMNSNGAVWFDYDRDGYLDLYVTGYFREDVDMWNITSTRIMQNSFEFATNGGRNRLYRNLGGYRFEDVTERMGVGSTRWTLAAAAADFDDNGWPDLYLANDYGPEELFLNDGGERFTLTNAGLADDSKSGMSVSLGDVYNRGRLDVFVTNISERGYLFQGNNLRINFLSELQRFENVAKGPIADAGWAWGAQFGDLNNDGWLELFVTNGFISADRNRDYWYGMSKVGGAQGLIFEDAANWPPIGTASLSGYQRSRLYVDPGDGQFVDIAEVAGVSDQLDGRSVVMADLWNRGMLDVVIANQNGRPLVYRNRAQHNGHWIAFDLVGTESNRSAIGAEVVVQFGRRSQRRVVDGGMGFASQNDRRLHFGLGESEHVDRVEIRWPSGNNQVLVDPATDQTHRIVEESGKPDE